MSDESDACRILEEAEQTLRAVQRPAPPLVVIYIPWMTFADGANVWGWSEGGWRVS